jgi:hypothetical protein
MTTVVNISGGNLMPASMNYDGMQQNPLALARQLLMQNPQLSAMGHGCCPPSMPPGMGGPGTLGQQGAMLYAAGVAFKRMDMDNIGDAMKKAGKHLMKADAIMGGLPPMGGGMHTMGMPGMGMPGMGMPGMGQPMMPSMPMPMPMPQMGMPMPMPQMGGMPMGGMPMGGMPYMGGGMPPFSAMNNMMPSFMPGLGGAPGGILGNMLREGLEGFVGGAVQGALMGGPGGAMAGGLMGFTQGAMRGLLGMG